MENSINNLDKSKKRLGIIIAIATCAWALFSIYELVCAFLKIAGEQPFYAFGNSLSDIPYLSFMNLSYSFIIPSAFGLILAFFLLRLKNWARIATITWGTIISIVMFYKIYISIPWLISYRIYLGIGVLSNAFLIFIFILAFLVPLFITLYLLFSKKIKNAFVNPEERGYALAGFIINLCIAIDTFGHFFLYFPSLKFISWTEFLIRTSLFPSLSIIGLILSIIGLIKSKRKILSTLGLVLSILVVVLYLFTAWRPELLGGLSPSPYTPIW